MEYYKSIFDVCYGNVTLKIKIENNITIEWFNNTLFIK